MPKRLTSMYRCQSSIKTKHPTKGKKKVQDGRTQILTNNETSKEGTPPREEGQIKYL
jgi:hypothetical protein